MIQIVSATEYAERQELVVQVHLDDQRTVPNPQPQEYVEQEGVWVPDPAWQQQVPDPAWYMDPLTWSMQPVYTTDKDQKQERETYLASVKAETMLLALMELQRRTALVDQQQPQASEGTAITL